MSKTIEPIETRSALATTIRTIRGQLEHLDKLEGAAQEHLAGVMLSNADRVILTISADDAPDWCERETTHLRWDVLSAELDTIRDAYNGRTTDDKREAIAARERVASSLLASTRRGAAIAAAESRSIALLKLAEDASAKGTPVKLDDLRRQVRDGAPAPAKPGRASAGRAAKVVS